VEGPVGGSLDGGTGELPEDVCLDPASVDIAVVTGLDDAILLSR